MSKNCLFLLVTVLVALMGCAKKYQSPNARQLTANHRVIAIVPPRVTLTGRSSEASIAQEQREGMKVQQTLYSWFLTRKSQYQLPITLMTVQETNTRLETMRYFERTDLSPTDICQLLGVDGILITDYRFKSKASGAEATASTALLGFKPASGKTNISLELFDESTQQVIWSYYHRLYDYDRSSSITVSEKMYQSMPNRDALNLFAKRASKKLPYSRQSASFTLLNQTGI